MAESMQGLHRSHRCTEVSNKNIGESVTVMGWVQKRRNLGSLIFIDLRDRTGILQLVFDENDGEVFEKAKELRSEFVIAAEGKVRKRDGAVNEELATGDIEVTVDTLKILSESETPPFPVEDDVNTREDLRLQYRYLDLRRPTLQKNLKLRSDVTTFIRKFMSDEGFIEIETPTLCKSTPEGARDYLVPSRVHPGEFYHPRRLLGAARRRVHRPARRHPGPDHRHHRGRGPAVQGERPGPGPNSRPKRR